jgi:trans-2,3-dihydro-3-hydroxyanthranilate isomerase
MRIPFRLVDVFAEAPFGGNQLCVVPETPPELETATMQALALEIGFSETTFVTAVRPDGYDVRIFTPDDELPFAGHPTLGTAFTLAREDVIAAEATQRCGAGDIPVRIDLAAGSASMRQLEPEIGTEITDREAVAAAAGVQPEDLIPDLPIVPVSTGIPHTMVPVRDDAALRRAVRHDQLCSEVCANADAESLYLFVLRGAGDVRARMFDKGATIGEDPATGSAAGPLGAYLAMHGLIDTPASVVVAQGEQVSRPSFLHVSVGREGDRWALDVAGGVQPMGDGAFEI